MAGGNGRGLYWMDGVVYVRKSETKAERSTKNKQFKSPPNSNQIQKNQFKNIQKQIHVTDGGRTVRLYSRNAEDSTPKFPDVVARLKGWLADGTESVVIDGEVRPPLLLSCF